MQGITKTFTVKGTKGTSAQVTVTEEYDISTNASVLTVAVAVACSTYYGHTYYLNGTISAGGQTLQTMRSSAGTHHVTLSKLDTYYSIKGNGAPGSPWVSSALAHNNDGSLTVTVAVDFKGYENSGRGASGFSISGSRSVTLTQIPRASTLGATDAKIGSASVIAVSRKSTDYTHSIFYSFGSLSGYLTESGAITATETKFAATGIAFTLPESFYYQIPKAPSAKCTLSCTTYLGNTQIGDKQTCTFTVTADPSLCAPLVIGTVTDSNAATTALTGDPAVLVRYASEAKCTISAEGRFGAAITEKTVSGSAVSESTVTLPAAESYVFAATDSRGYRTAVSVTPKVVPYVILTCRAAAKRDDPTSGKATLTITGECFGGSFGAVSNQLTLRYRVGTGEWASLTPVFKDHTYTATAALTDMDYTQRYTVTVSAADALRTAESSVTLDKGIPVFDWGENDFRFHVPVHMQGGVYGSGYVPAMESTEHPGCYYRTVSDRTEWLNPPMVEDTEYCTTERYMGKPVYVKLINCGALPDTGSKTVAHGISDTVIGFLGFAVNASGLVQQMPLVATNLTVNAKMHVTAAHVTLVTGSNMTAYSATAIIRYTK